MSYRAGPKDLVAVALRRAGFHLPRNIISADIVMVNDGLMTLKLEVAVLTDEVDKLANALRLMADYQIGNYPRCDGQHIGPPCIDPQCWGD